MESNFKANENKIMDKAAKIEELKTARLKLEMHNQNMRLFEELDDNQIYTITNPQPIKEDNILLRLPIIRHARAIFELLNIFFWKNTLGKGDYIQPEGDDIENIYNIWYGHKSEKISLPNELYLKIPPPHAIIIKKLFKR